MEMRRLMQKKHPNAKSPRKAFDDDLAKMINQKLKDGSPVLLLMDANTPPDSTEMKQFMRKTGLKNLFRVLHPTIPFPRTYDRGTTCLDFPLASDEAIKMVKEMGYLPFYTLGPDDHRAMFLDLYYDKLKYESCSADSTRTTTTTPSIRRPAEMRTFIERYKSLLEQANIFEKVEEIRRRFERATETERTYLRQHLDKYDAVWVQLAQAAAKTASAKYAGTRPWSPTLARKGAICRYWNQRIRRYYTEGTLNCDNIQIPSKFVPQLVQTEEDLIRYHSEALQDWHTVKGNSAALRVQHLEDLIQYYMEQRNVKRETAVKQLLHWEELRNLHTRHTNIMSRSKPNVIKSLIIPRPHSTDPTALMEVTNPDFIQDIILRRNASKLGAAHGSPFTTEPLLGMVGSHGDTTYADALLDGTYPIDQIDTWQDVEYRHELKIFLQHMQRPHDADGAPIPDMKWDYGPDEFRDTFSKKREDTGCGPSGITMQYYRIFCLDDDLAKLHATFIFLPFKYGFSLKRWQNSVHFMLMKIDVPLWEKLRIIQLLEGDFNGGLRFLFGRRLMHYSVAKKITSDATYGGRPGRSCHDALLRIQLSMEYCRIQRLLAAFMDIDATACFDNQIRNLIGLMTRRLGADKNISRCQTITLEQMNHRVRIQQGVSKESIAHSSDRPLYGSGQGSGAGVINWHGHNETLIAMYDATQPGCRMTSPDGLLEIIQKVISFVDDNKLMRSFLENTSIQEAMHSCTQSINFWSRSLEITGGKLDPEKSKMQFLSYDFDTYSYRKHYPYRGMPVMMTTAQQHGECLLYDSTRKTSVPLEKIEPHKGRKLLGVRLAADGTCTDEYLARKGQSELMALRLERSTASPVDAYMIYVFRFCPAVFYCLPLTYFTPDQCNAIQAPFINVLLPKLRMNRHIKRDIVWGPQKFGGLNLAHMATEQIARTTEHLIGHVRAKTPTGLTFVITCAAYQLYLGIQQPFFLTDPSQCPHRMSKRSCKLTYLWETLHEKGCAVYLGNQWLPESRQTVCIMDAVIRTHISNKGTTKCIRDENVRLVNACRLWLKAVYVEDLFMANGEVDLDLLNGSKQCETDLDFPTQPRPPPWVWKIWKQVIIQSCLRRGSNNHLLYHFSSTQQTSWMPPQMTLPQSVEPAMTLQQIVHLLPEPYQLVLGQIDYPADDGQALARDILNGNAMLYSDGTVENGCGAHAYTLRSQCDSPERAITGAAPTSGDPTTISSLRTEHFGGLAGLVWVWILVKKYHIEEGHVNGAIDNLTVVNRLNDGLEGSEGHKTHLSTDIDVWKETDVLLSSIPITCTFRHVKGHQDDMYKRGEQGPLPRDVFWNVNMDKRAEQARLTVPLDTDAVFGSSPAEFYAHGKPIHTKIGNKIRSIFLENPLRRYIQNKEEWDDETFDQVDWKAFDACMNKLTIHKRINVAKYIFNWQNTGRQKQFFEDAQARTDKRQPENVARCPMGCGMTEYPQHYLQCPILHRSKLITRDFDAVRVWMEKQNTSPEMRIIITKGLVHWMEFGEPIEIWELADTPYKEEFENAIQAQNFIRWDNMLKGRLAHHWGDIQMKFYEETHDEVPRHLSATTWASELIRQLLYFSLSAWQHRNNHLHETEEATRRVREREEAVESMAYWYGRQNEFPADDKPNFARSFLERCTDTTAQIRLWLGKIVDIHQYNQRTTLRGYFSLTE